MGSMTLDNEGRRYCVLFTRSLRGVYVAALWRGEGGGTEMALIYC
jgi:hypothetical protein